MLCGPTSTQDHVQGGTISSAVAVAVCHAGMAIKLHIRPSVLAACPCEPQSVSELSKLKKAK